jgi:cobalt/nickel transport system ATP-binding protein
MIEAKNVSFSYPGGVAALKDVSFRLADGKKYALVGANGAGKSTLLSLLCALEYPQSGMIQMDGVPVDKAHTQQIRDHVGMVFQNPDDQLFMPTVYEDIAFGLRSRGVPEDEVSRRVNGLMERLGISHLKDRPPYRLSGGEKRIAAIATALVLEPRLLLMDEPTAFLDPRAKAGFLRLIQGLDIGMLIATHDLALAREHMDGVVILKEGNIYAQGEAALLEDNDLLNEALLA